MANIQTLNGLRGRGNNNQNRRNNIQNNAVSNEQIRQNNQFGSMFDGENMGVTVQNIRFAEQQRVMFLSGKKVLKNPKDQNYWDMLQETCCPVFKCLSFTSFILIVDLAMFITSLALGLNAAGQLLQIKADTLLNLGANQATRVKQGQVYRLLGAIVLHANFIHILGNTVTTFIFLSRVQYTYGFWKTAIFYVVAGVSGNIFSVLAASQGVKVGASTSLYGVLGLILGYIIINWSGLDRVGQIMKCQLLFLMIFVIIFILAFTSASQSIDYFGHLGGFLAGLWLSAFHKTLIEETRQKVIRGVFISLLVIQFLLLFLIFYLKR